LPFRQASVERITVWTARHLAAPIRFNPTIAGSEPVGTGSALAISGGSGARGHVGEAGLHFAQARQADSVLGQRVTDHRADHVALLHRV
jgi:hypothetical protein